jgi:DNA polymerase-3 subunit epsilon
MTTRFRELELLCLDVETTGLDARRDEIVSLGWVVIRAGRVDLSTAATFLVRPTGDVGQSATIHGLTDSTVAKGGTLEAVLERLLESMAGRVLVVHHAGLDKTLLDRDCHRCYGAPLLVPVVDTLAVERRSRRRRQVTTPDGSLRLADLRREYGLPRYAAHDAMTDALATAELLLAMVWRRGGPGNVRLRDLV